MNTQKDFKNSTRRCKGNIKCLSGLKTQEEASSDDNEDSDPIGDLLKSNTSVFGKKTEMLR